MAAPTLPPELVRQIIELTLPPLPPIAPFAPHRPHLAHLASLSRVNRVFHAIVREYFFHTLQLTNKVQADLFLESTRPVLPDPYRAREAREARFAAFGSGRWADGELGKVVSGEQVGRVLARGRKLEEVWIWRVLDVALPDVSKATNLKKLYLFCPLVPLPTPETERARRSNPFGPERPRLTFAFNHLVRLALLDARPSDVTAIIAEPELFPSLRELVILDGHTRVEDSFDALDEPLRLRRALHLSNPFFGRLEALVLGGETRGTPSPFLDSLYPYALRCATNLKHLTVAGDTRPFLTATTLPPSLESLDIHNRSDETTCLLFQSLTVVLMAAARSRSLAGHHLENLKSVRFSIVAPKSEWEEIVDLLVSYHSFLMISRMAGLEVVEVELYPETVEGALQRCIERFDEVAVERADRWKGEAEKLQ